MFIPCMSSVLVEWQGSYSVHNVGQSVQSCFVETQWSSWNLRGRYIAFISLVLLCGVTWNQSFFHVCVLCIQPIAWTYARVKTCLNKQVLPSCDIITEEWVKWSIMRECREWDCNTICRCREYVTSWLLDHAWFLHLLATHWLCIVIILIVVQITVEREPVTRQRSILTSDYDGELKEVFKMSD